MKNQYLAITIGLSLLLSTNTYAGSATGDKEVRCENSIQFEKNSQGTAGQACVRLIRAVNIANSNLQKSDSVAEAYKARSSNDMKAKDSQVAFLNEFKGLAADGANKNRFSAMVLRNNAKDLEAAIKDAKKSVTGLSLFIKNNQKDPDKREIVAIAQRSIAEFKRINDQLQPRKMLYQVIAAVQDRNSGANTLDLLRMKVNGSAQDLGTLGPEGGKFIVLADDKIGKFFNTLEIKNVDGEWQLIQPGEKPITISDEQYRAIKNKITNGEISEKNLMATFGGGQYTRDSYSHFGRPQAAHREALLGVGSEPQLDLSCPIDSCDEASIPKITFEQKVRCPIGHCTIGNQGAFVTDDELEVMLPKTARNQKTNPAYEAWLNCRNAGNSRACGVRPPPTISIMAAPSPEKVGDRKDGINEHACKFFKNYQWYPALNGCYVVRVDN